MERTEKRRFFADEVKIKNTNVYCLALLAVFVSLIQRIIAAAKVADGTFPPVGEIGNLHLWVDVDIVI